MAEDLNLELEDINDAFNYIAFSEENFHKQGFEEGLMKGETEGRIDGYHLGFHRGLETGTEIGFYKGVVKVILDNFECLPPKNREKAVKVTRQLNDFLEKFPKDNSEDVDILLEMNEIRALYRKLESLLKLKLFPQSFASVMSF